MINRLLNFLNASPVNFLAARNIVRNLEDAGYTVERKQNIAGSVVHTAITSGEIDLYPEYTGTGLLAILQLLPS